MATWKTEIQKIDNGISTTFKNITNNAENFFSGTVKKVVADVQSFFTNGSTVVGINVNQIPSMKSAITDYCNGVETALQELKNYDPTVAFQGEETVSALKKYIEAVQEACGAIVSQLLAFNDELTKVENAYKAKDTASASAINSDASAMSNSYTRYTSQ